MEVCLSPFHLVLFLEILPVLPFWTCFFVSTFWLLPYVCFYILGGVAVSLRLGRMALWSRCPVGSSGAASLITRAGLSRLARMGHVHCHVVLVVLELWLLLVSPGEIDPWADQLWRQAITTAEELLCRSRPYGAGFVSVGFWSTPWVCHLWSW